MRPFPPAVALTLLIAIAAAMILIPAHPSHAQQGPQWIHFDESPDGTPATVEVIAGDSGVEVTRFVVTLHGFWMEPVMGPDQRVYNRYEFPGLGVIAQEGAPEFPRLVLRIAVPTTAQELTLRSATIEEQRIYQGVLPYPMPDPGVEDGAEEWRYDQKLYEGSAVFPPAVFPQAAPMKQFLNTLPGGDLEIFPVQWNPLSRELRVINILDIVYNHEGTIENREAMTRHRARMGAGLFRNWDVVEDFFPVDTTEYVGSYLFVYPSAMEDSIAALVDQKWARGFHVTELTTEFIGDTCGEIRNAIGNWHSSVEARGDAYALLVGDQEDIPLCMVLIEGSDETYHTDDVYASPSHLDLIEEVFLGRLSVDDAADLGQQVRKILNYENNPRFYGEYRDALLIAHLQDAPGKYEGLCEEVRTETYSTPPTFLTCYGSVGDSDSDIRREINSDLGVVAYRGHGSEWGWGHWNTHGESYHIDDLPGLVNDDMTPVVWSITCNTGNIRHSDCFAEHFMLGDEHRGVAFYGATAGTARLPNDWLEKTLFKSVYDDDVTIHSHAIMLAEERMVLETWERNAWLYLLLGDPEMTIRRRAPGELVMMAPQTMQVCTSPPCWLEAQVMDDQGQPLPDLIVSAWMPPPQGKQSTNTPAWDQKRQPPVGGVLSNRYSDDEGKVRLPAEPAAEGWILLTARDDFGRVLTDSVQVVTGTGTPAGLAPLILSPHPAVMSEQTTFHFGRGLDTAFRLEIYDQRGRLVRRLQSERGPDQMLWDGRDGSGQRVGSGVYLVRLIGEGRRLSTKVVRVR